MKNRIILILVVLFSFMSYSQTITEDKKLAIEVNKNNDNYTIFYLNNKYKYLIKIKYINIGDLENAKRILSTRNEFISVGDKLMQIKQVGKRITIYVSYRGVLSYTRPMSVKQFNKLFTL